MTVRLERRITTGSFCTNESYMFTCTLSAKLGNGSVDIRDGEGGPIRLTLNCGNNASVLWRCGSPAGVKFVSGIHATLTGSANDAALSISYEQPTYS